MAEVIELLPKGAIEKLSRKKKAGRFRLVALAKSQRAGPIEEEASQPVQEAPDQARMVPNSVDSPDCSSGQDARTPSAGETPALPGETAALAGEKPEAEECIDLFEIREGCLAVVWKLAKVDDWGAPVLGAACKEILGKKRIRKVVFDFTGVREMSTAAVSTLIRFQNTIAHLEKTMCLVAGPELRKQLTHSHVDRMIEVVQSVAQVIGTEVRFQERPVVRRQRKPWWKLFLLLLVTLLMQATTAFGQSTEPTSEFPTLFEMEKLLPEAPELQVILLEIEKLRLETSWTRHVSFHTSYSQHFSAYVPVLSPSDRKISGDTLILGVSASLALDELVQGRRKDRLELRLKQVEYQRVYQAKLAALRILYGNRDRLGEQTKALEAQAKTAGLKIERVRAGLQFEFLSFTAIDLAEAEEAVARLEAERRETKLEIESVEIRILEVVGKGESGP